MTIEENIREYANARISTYIEQMTPKQKISDQDEMRMYDNIKEVLSLIDYCFIQLDFRTELKIRTVEARHKAQVNKLIREGKIPML